MQQLEPCSMSCLTSGFGLCDLGDLPIEKREASCSSQQISELPENHKDDL